MVPLGFSSQLHVQCRHAGSWKSATVGALTPWKWANTANQAFCLGELVVEYLLVCHCIPHRHSTCKPRARKTDRLPERMPLFSLGKIRYIFIHWLISSSSFLTLSILCMWKNHSEIGPWLHQAAEGVIGTKKVKNVCPGARRRFFFF